MLFLVVDNVEARNLPNNPKFPKLLHRYNCKFQEGSLICASLFCSLIGQM